MADGALQEMDDPLVLALRNTLAHKRKHVDVGAPPAARRAKHGRAQAAPPTPPPHPQRKRKPHARVDEDEEEEKAPRRPRKQNKPTTTTTTTHQREGRVEDGDAEECKNQHQETVARAKAGLRAGFDSLKAQVEQSLVDSGFSLRSCEPILAALDCLCHEAQLLHVCSHDRPPSVLESDDHAQEAHEQTRLAMSWARIWDTARAEGLVSACFAASARDAFPTTESASSSNACCRLHPDGQARLGNVSASIKAFVHEMHKAWQGAFVLTPRNPARPAWVNPSLAWCHDLLAYTPYLTTSANGHTMHCAPKCSCATCEMSANVVEPRAPMQEIRAFLSSEALALDFRDHAMSYNVMAALAGIAVPKAARHDAVRLCARAWDTVVACVLAYLPELTTHSVCVRARVRVPLLREDSLPQCGAKHLGNDLHDVAEAHQRWSKYCARSVSLPMWFGSAAFIGASCFTRVCHVALHKPSLQHHPGQKTLPVLQHPLKLSRSSRESFLDWGLLRAPPPPAGRDRALRFYARLIRLAEPPRDLCPPRPPCVIENLQGRMAWGVNGASPLDLAWIVSTVPQAYEFPPDACCSGSPAVLVSPLGSAAHARLPTTSIRVPLRYARDKRATRGAFCVVRVPCVGTDDDVQDMLVHLDVVTESLWLHDLAAALLTQSGCALSAHHFHQPVHAGRFARNKAEADARGNAAGEVLAWWLPKGALWMVGGVPSNTFLVVCGDATIGKFSVARDDAHSPPYITTCGSQSFVAPHGALAPHPPKPLWLSPFATPPKCRALELVPGGVCCSLWTTAAWNVGTHAEPHFADQWWLWIVDANCLAHLALFEITNGKPQHVARRHRPRDMRLIVGPLGVIFVQVDENEVTLANGKKQPMAAQLHAYATCAPFVEFPPHLDWDLSSRYRFVPMDLTYPEPLAVSRIAADADWVARGERPQFRSSSLGFLGDTLVGLMPDRLVVWPPLPNIFDEPFKHQAPAVNFGCPLV